MKKVNLGSAVILIGVAIIGFIWFKKNKPTISNKQLANITNKSNALNTGSAGKIDKPIDVPKGVDLQGNIGANPYVISPININYNNLTPKQYQDIKNSIGNIPDPSAIYSGQRVLSNENLNSLNQLSNYDFSNVNWSNLDWSNIKIK